MTWAQWQQAKEMGVPQHGIQNTARTRLDDFEPAKTKKNHLPLSKPHGSVPKLPRLNLGLSVPEPSLRPGNSHPNSQNQQKHSRALGSPRKVILFHLTGWPFQQNHRDDIPVAPVESVANLQSSTHGDAIEAALPNEPRHRTLYQQSDEVFQISSL